MIFHHHHAHFHSKRDLIEVDSAVPSVQSGLNSISTPTLSESTSTQLAKRDTFSCSPDDSSAQCETPTHLNALALSLGIVIPLVGAIVVLIYLHFRHLKKLKKETEDDKDIDVDNDDWTPQEYEKMDKGPLYPYSISDKGVSRENLVPDDNISLQKPSPIASQNPFAGPHTPSGLASSKNSLYDYDDPYNLRAYPPSGITYDAPQYPPSISRPSSPASSLSSLGNDSHSGVYNSSLKGSSTTTLVPERSNTGIHIKPLPKLDSYSGKNDNPATDRSINNNGMAFSYDNEKSSPTVSIGSLSTVATSNEDNVPTTDVTAQAHAPENPFNSEINTPTTKVNHDESIFVDQPIVNQETLDTIDLDNSDFKQKVKRSQSGGKNNFDRVKSVYKEYFSPEEESPSKEANSQQVGKAVPLQDPQGVNLEEKINNQTSSYDFDQDQTRKNPFKLPTIVVPKEVSGPNGELDGHESFYHQDPNAHLYHQSHESLNDPHHSNIDHEYHPQNLYYNEAVHSVQTLSPIDSGSPYTESGYSNLREPVIVPPTSSSQQSFRSVQQLPELTSLPTPHKLEETGSSINFAPQRRNNIPGVTAIGVYNPLTNPLVLAEDASLMSPSQMRQSVAMISPAGFLPPKKYVPHKDISDVQEEDGISPLRPGFNVRGARTQQRPPSSLVPDPHSQLEKLKPTMNMVT